jgi:hypothetical protein
MEVVMELVLNKEEKIKARAYELFMAGGCNPGNDLEHWLQAEKEILQELNQQSKGNTSVAKKPPQSRGRLL